jgi:DnaK suppressor protein
MEMARRDELRANLLMIGQELDRQIVGHHLKARNARENLPPGESMDLSESELKQAAMKASTRQQVEEALQRLERGEYGLCRDCAGEISAVRLIALPFAIRCNPCQETRDSATAKKPRQGMGGKYIHRSVSVQA